MFVERVLREAGHKTAVALTAQPPSKPRRSDRSTLVTDVMMPGMTGDELARRLRQSDPQLKVLPDRYSDRLFKEKTMLWEAEAFSTSRAQSQACAGDLVVAVRPLRSVRVLAP
jgi:CheY-like chemotaxis protein